MVFLSSPRAVAVKRYIESCLTDRAVFFPNPTPLSTAKKVLLQGSPAFQRNGVVMRRYVWTGSCLTRTGTIRHRDHRVLFDASALSFLQNRGEKAPPTTIQIPVVREESS